MDTVTARERLEEMRGQIDRSILVLQGEHPSGRATTDSPQDPADAGTTLSETDRTEAALAAVQSGWSWTRSCGSTAGSTERAPTAVSRSPRAGWMPGRRRPAAWRASPSGTGAIEPARRRQPGVFGLRAVATRLIPNASSALPPAAGS